jgi:hypothetical protein
VNFRKWQANVCDCKQTSEHNVKKAKHSAKRKPKAKKYEPHWMNALLEEGNLINAFSDWIQRNHQKAHLGTAARQARKLENEPKKRSHKAACEMPQKKEKIIACSPLRKA